MVIQTPECTRTEVDAEDSLHAISGSLRGMLRRRQHPAMPAARVDRENAKTLRFCLGPPYNLVLRHQQHVADERGECLIFVRWARWVAPIAALLIVVGSLLALDMKLHRLQPELVAVCLIRFGGRFSYAA